MLLPMFRGTGVEHGHHTRGGASGDDFDHPELAGCFLKRAQSNGSPSINLGAQRGLEGKVMEGSRLPTIHGLNLVTGRRLPHR